MNKLDRKLNMIRQKLLSLRAEGYFVSIAPKEEDYILECRIYITDKDDETGTINILEIPEHEVRDENDKCLGCKSVPGEVRTLSRGCISCPLGCGSFTKPFALIEKIYRTKLGSNLGSMPSQMASTISAALK